MDKETALLAGETSEISATEFSEHVDVAAVLGGDGTMMHAVARLGNFEKPVAGINIGTLGFLTTCTDTEIETLSDAIARGSYQTSVRMLLNARVVRKTGTVETYHGLNEVTRKPLER